MRFAIVEDEKIFMEKLKDTLHLWNANKDDLEIFAFFSGEDILHHYRSKHIDFDIIFMDIKLGGIDGLLTAKQMREIGFEKAIAFTTNHTEFELTQKSFTVGAIHYFAKPISVENIQSCVDLLQPTQKYIYTHNKKQIVVPCKEIVYFESAKNYVKIHVLGERLEEKYKHRMKLGKIIDHLPRNFVQCHRSYIVNIFHVTTIMNNHLHMRMQTKLLPIGDTYLDTVLSAFYQP